MLLFRGVKYAQKCLCRLPDRAKVEVLQRNASHDRFRPTFKILVRHISKILLQIPFDIWLAFEGARSSAGSEDSVDYFLPNIAATTSRFCCHCECPNGYSRPESRNFSLQCYALIHRLDVHNEKTRARSLHPLRPFP